MNRKDEIINHLSKEYHYYSFLNISDNDNIIKYINNINNLLIKYENL